MRRAAFFMASPQPSRQQQERSRDRLAKTGLPTAAPHGQGTPSKLRAAEKFFRGTLLGRRPTCRTFVRSAAGAGNCLKHLALPLSPFFQKQPHQPENKKTASCDISAAEGHFHSVSHLTFRLRRGCRKTLPLFQFRTIFPADSVRWWMYRIRVVRFVLTIYAGTWPAGTP